MSAGSAKSHEKPASVTSATPAMVIQWLVNRTITGCFWGSGISVCLVLGVQISDQVRHFRSGEARPRDALGFHLVEHLRAVMPEDGNDGGGVERAARARDLGRSVRKLVMTRRATLGREDFRSGGGIARVREKLAGPQIAHDLAHLGEGEWSRRGGHARLVFPHVDGDIGQRFALEF